MSEQVLCALSDLSDPGSKGIELGDLNIVLVRIGDRVFAYRNACPHLGVNMEWMPDQFLDVSGTLIQCAMHGALFRPEDGYCVRGPCVAQSLEALPVSVENGQIILSH